MGSHSNPHKNFHTMKFYITLALLLHIALCSKIANLAKNHARRLGGPRSIGEATKYVADWLEMVHPTIKIDVNQVQGAVFSILRGAGTESAEIVNLDVLGRDHTFYCMPDTVDLWCNFSCKP